ncbi:MAG: enoyl-CoA hydratase-related protein [Polyangiaceae bacterium]|nr:enoyl-CoA hydratase-related protein [Polyangiaceae bacterium]
MRKDQAYELVLVERDGALATLTLNRPDKLNALNAALIGELTDAFEALSREASPPRALVLTGAGEKAFAAGADIAAMTNLGAPAARAFAAAGHRLGEAIESAPFPVLAAVNGFALGGGCELALACDLIYASEKAKFGQPEVNLGVIPGFGGSQRLPRAVGPQKAREMIFTGASLDAAEAKRLGLVCEVFPPDELLARVREIAATIAKKGPLAITAAKRVMRAGADVPLPTANELEAQAFAALFGTALFGSDDQREGMSAFLAKRPANFHGR